MGYADTLQLPLIDLLVDSVSLHSRPQPQITNGRFPQQEGVPPLPPTHLSNPHPLLKTFFFFSPPIFFFILQHLNQRSSDKKGVLVPRWGRLLPRFSFRGKEKKELRSDFKLLSFGAQGWGPGVQLR